MPRKEYNVTINQNLCILCEECIPKCDQRVFQQSFAGDWTIFEENCNFCGICIEICPVNCISITKSSEIQVSEIKKEQELNQFRRQQIKSLLKGKDQISLNSILGSLLFKNKRQFEDWIINNEIYPPCFISGEFLVKITSEKTSTEGESFQKIENKVSSPIENNMNRGNIQDEDGLDEEIAYLESKQKKRRWFKR